MPRCAVGRRLPFADEALMRLVRSFHYGLALTPCALTARV
jgi:hypothetical protein